MAGSGTAGWLDGVGTSAQFNGPMSGFGDTTGNLFVVDDNNQRVRKMTSAGPRSGFTTFVVLIPESFHDGV